jgi:hypothetical protein
VFKSNWSGDSECICFTIYDNESIIIIAGLYRDILLAKKSGIEKELSEM